MGSFIFLSPLIITIFISTSILGVILFWSGIKESKQNNHGDWWVVVTAFALIAFIFGVARVNTFRSEQSLANLAIGKFRLR